MASDQPRQPSGMAAPSGRCAAVKALSAIEKARWLADDLFDQVTAQDSLDLRERAFMVELVRGVLRYRGTIDWRLGAVSDRPIARLPMVVQTILRLGAYQLLYLDRVPESAAVNEAVRMMRRHGKRLGRDWSGFVNAVLRSLLRSSEPDRPDAEKDPVEAFAVRYSCPTWLVERWCRLWGVEQAEVLCHASLEPPPLTLRVNTLRTSRRELLAELAAAQVDVAPTMVSPVGIHLARSGSVADLPGYGDGRFYVEDEAAQLIPPLLDVRPGQRVLDACAAPGGKATHLAALMENRGTLVAVDRSAARLGLVMENGRRLGITCVTPVVGELRALTGLETSSNTLHARRSAGQEALRSPFDRILLDAPCSGLGVLRRHPEGKWYKTPESIMHHRDGQRELLEATSRLLRPGGLMVYSTCSIEPEETASIIEEFCRSHHEFQRESIAPWLPPAGLPFVTPQGDLSTMANTNRMDAFFAARLRRSE